MVGAGLGLSLRGKVAFVSTFAAFLTRAFDQIRMSQYSDSNIKFCGSHAGVSIGVDGSSQMGLEDIAMFRTIQNSVVLYPSDAVSAEKLVEEAAKHKGIVYLRTTREDTPIIYRNDEVFRIGGSKVLKRNPKDVATVVAAGITLHEALAAYEELKKDDIFIGRDRPVQHQADRCPDAHQGRARHGDDHYRGRPFRRRRDQRGGQECTGRRSRRYTFPGSAKHAEERAAEGTS